MFSMVLFVMYACVCVFLALVVPSAVFVEVKTKPQGKSPRLHAMFGEP